MTTVDDDEDRPRKTATPFSNQSSNPRAEEGLDLMKAFQDIVSPADRAKVIALARKLASSK